ncbi:MAG: Ig domain-containing protein [Ignavibacteriota bacterium]
MSALCLPATGAASGATYSITGKPGAAGAYSFTVQAKDSAGATQTQSFSGTIGSMPSVSAFSLTAVPSSANQYTANLSFTKRAAIGAQRFGLPDVQSRPQCVERQFLCKPGSAVRQRQYELCVRADPEEHPDLHGAGG